MPSSCSVPHCKTAAGSKKTDASQGLSVHSFPRDPFLRQEWIENICRGRDWQPGKNAKVCSLHFTEDCYKLESTDDHPTRIFDRRAKKIVGLKRSILKPDAVPTLFVNCPTCMAGNKNSPNVKCQAVPMECVHCENFESFFENDLKFHVSALHLGYFPIGCGHCLDNKVPCWMATHDGLESHTALKHPGLDADSRPNYDEAKEERLAELISACTNRKSTRRKKKNSKNEEEVGDEEKTNAVKSFRKRKSAETAPESSGAVTEPEHKRKYSTRSSARLSCGIDLLLTAAGQTPTQTEEECDNPERERSQTPVLSVDSTLPVIQQEQIGEVSTSPLTLSQSTPPKSLREQEEKAEKYKLPQAEVQKSDSKNTINVREISSKITMLSRNTKPKTPARYSLAFVRQKEQEKEVNKEPRQETTAVSIDKEEEQNDTSREIFVVDEQPVDIDFIGEQTEIRTDTTADDSARKILRTVGPSLSPAQFGFPVHKQQQPPATPVREIYPMAARGLVFRERKKTTRKMPSERHLNLLLQLKQKQQEALKSELTFTCKLCNKKIARTKDHVISAHFEQPYYICKYCGYHGGSRRAVHRHQYEEHRGDPKVVNVNEAMEEEVAQNHVVCFGFDYRTAAFPCTLCSQVVPFTQSMAAHTAAHRDPIKCGHCKSVFGAVDDFLLHHTQQHPDLLHDIKNPARLELYNACFPPGTEPQVVEPQEKAPEKPRIFAMQTNRCQISLECLKCSRLVSIRNADSHARQHSESRFCCPFCNFMSHSSQAIRKHIQRIHPNKQQDVLAPGNRKSLESRASVVECFGFNKVQCSQCHQAQSFCAVVKHINEHMEEEDTSESGNDVVFDEMALRCFEGMLHINV